MTTPPAVFGLSPGMAATLFYQAGFDRSVVARTAVGSLMRSFTLPIELSGISMTINGAACGLKSVSRHRIEFVVPPGLASSSAGTNYSLEQIDLRLQVFTVQLNRRSHWLGARKKLKQSNPRLGHGR